MTHAFLKESSPFLTANASLNHCQSCFFTTSKALVRLVFYEVILACLLGSVVDV